ncbi:Rieske 2Fe-2S domain-containing protein [Dyella jejuensis]|uniref:Rieske 2Fe-2S domain-containing protein n=1 Tax=Dyella jejuensis TaxID=1432009 RepID=A0ABW8JN72_9GAMM
MPIDLRSYSERSAFDQEISSLFEQRFFVGNAASFKEIDTYKSFALGKKIVTVRKTAAGIKAFANVCLHRSNIIDPLGEGKRHFSCGFHGWSYDANGELSLAPFSERSCIKNRNLASFPIIESGGLLFTGLSGALPIVDKVPGALEKIGMTVSAPFHKEHILHKCNWKLLVENILESYHLNFVHRNTFLKSGFTSTSIHEWAAEDYVNLASITPLPSTDKTTAIRRLARNAAHVYRHAYIFPNLFISNTNDLVGFISHIIPLDEKTTQLSWELFELPQLFALPAPVREHVRNEAIQFSQTTLEEDRTMVESCQIGISSEMRSVQLQAIEDRVSHFHDFYNRHMIHAQ